MNQFWQSGCFKLIVRAGALAVLAAGISACEQYIPEAPSLATDSGDEVSLPSTQIARAGDIMVIGGGSVVTLNANGTNFKSTPTAEIFKAATKTFVPADALTVPRGGIQAIPFTTGPRAHQILVPGGATGTGVFNANNGNITVNATSQQSSELYKAGLFVAGASMSGKRAFYTATVLKSGAVLITGGFNGKVPLKTAQIYNPVTNKFSPAASTMTVPRAMHTATLLPNGMVLLAGGIIDVHGTTTRTAELYNPSTRKFTKLTDKMRKGVAGHTATLITGCCKPGDGWVVIAGGFSGSGTAAQPAFETTVTDIVIFDPVRKFFQTAAQMHDSRGFHTATLVGGKVHLAGGVFGTTAYGNNIFTQYVGGGLRQSVEIYDLQLGSITCVGGVVGARCKNAMRSPRGAHTATVFTSGPLKNKVLLAGGHPNKSAEIYNPVTGTFLLTGKMKSARGFHAAVVTP